jgi:hypothetical protein
MIRLVDYPTLLFIFLFISYSVALEIGFRIAARGQAHDDPALHEQAIGARDGVVVLLSLLLGFTLALSLPRSDLRRQLIVDESNAIGTADLRAQMLPEPERTKTLDLLRSYTDARVEFSETSGTPGASDASTARSHALQDELWTQAKAAAVAAPTPVTSMYISALNDVIDLEAKRVAARRSRVPISIWIMLFCLSILACLSSGFTLRRRFLLSMIVAPLMIAIVMALIADLDTPGRGFIRVDLSSIRELQNGLHNQSPK